jgi:hypothetical protein
MTLKLTHPVTKDTIETSESYEEMYRSQGWVSPAEAKKTDAKSTKADEK